MGALEFGQLIKQARLRRGWQQQDLADRIEVDRGYISTIENGKRNWPQSYISALSKHLDLDEVDMAVAAGLISPRRDRPKPPVDSLRAQVVAVLERTRLTDDRADTLKGLMERWQGFDRRTEDTINHVDTPINHSGHRRSK